ncbi:hypothetical protein Hanom_Chr03g00186861 [Helianthus anomalus]
MQVGTQNRWRRWTADQEYIFFKEHLNLMIIRLNGLGTAPGHQAPSSSIHTASTRLVLSS